MTGPTADEREAGHRPGKLVVVLGTGTEVGKTWVCSRLAQALSAAGWAVAARKTAQSFGPDDGPTDAEVLAGATGATPTEVCPPERWYPIAMAPPMAADALGRPPFTLADLLGELRWPPGTAVGLLEGAGGPRSPLADDADNVDLVRAVRPDHVVLVADAGLGTISAVRLAVEALAPTTPLVLLNRFAGSGDGAALHEANRRWLTERHDLTTFHDISLLMRHLLPPGDAHPGRRP